MPRLLIHKEGQMPFLESPEMSPEACEQQRQLVASKISVAHGGPADATSEAGSGNRERDKVLELRWCSIAAHVVTGVEVGEPGAWPSEAQPVAEAPVEPQQSPVDATGGAF
jgi:hypothetical protein